MELETTRSLAWLVKSIRSIFGTRNNDHRAKGGKEERRSLAIQKVSLLAIEFYVTHNRARMKEKYAHLSSLTSLRNAVKNIIHLMQWARVRPYKSMQDLDKRRYDREMQEYTTNANALDGNEDPEGTRGRSFAV